MVKEQFAAILLCSRLSTALNSVMPRAVGEISIWTVVVESRSALLRPPWKYQRGTGMKR